MISVKNSQLEIDGKKYQCALGKKGLANNKHEGDNCTPIGEFPIREVFYRADKIAKPETTLPVTEIKEDDGWCDAPDDVNYNKKVKLPYPASHEKLWRDDDLYDIVVVLGYNDEPVVPGNGSAIFMHVVKPGYLGTEGCVALKKEDLLEVLKHLPADSKIRISA